jgi:hypothetical protein
MDHLYLEHEDTRYKAGLEHLYSIELALRESIDLVSGVATCRTTCHGSPDASVVLKHVTGN